jgi:hypothetical protein
MKFDIKVPFEGPVSLLPTLNLDRRRLLRTGLTSSVALSQAFNTGCSRKVERTFEYLQDVKLNDGKVITLRFKDVVLAYGKDTDNVKRLLKQEMWYEPLGIYYLDEPWNIDGAHRLMSFDIVNGVPMVVQNSHYSDVVRRDAHPEESVRLQQHHRCKFNYLKWMANKWIEVHESEFPGHIVGYNLGRATYPRGDSKTLQKYGMSNAPAMGDTPISIFQFGGCLAMLPDKQNKNLNQNK